MKKRLLQIGGFFRKLMRSRYVFVVLLVVLVLSVDDDFEYFYPEDTAFYHKLLLEMLEFLGVLALVIFCVVAVCFLFSKWFDHRQNVKLAKHDKAARMARLQEEAQQRILDTARAEGAQAALKADHAKVFNVMLQGFKPRRQLPRVEEGMRRRFFVRLHVVHPIARPTKDLGIHWFDEPVSSLSGTGLLGAPLYTWVESLNGRDQLVMLDMVYTMDKEPFDMTNW